MLRHIRRMGPLPESHVVHDVMQPLLQALQHLHAQVEMQLSHMHTAREVQYLKGSVEGCRSLWGLLH